MADETPAAPGEQTPPPEPLPPTAEGAVPAGEAAALTASADAPPNVFRARLRRIMQHRAWNAVMSVSAHVLIIMILAGVAGHAVKQIEKDVDVVLFEEPRGMPAPPAPPRPSTPKNAAEKVSAASSKSVASATANAASAASASAASKALSAPSAAVAFRGFNTPSVGTPSVVSEVKVSTSLGNQIQKGEMSRLAGVAAFQSGWFTGSGMGGSGGATGMGNKRQIKAKFTIFKAKYQDGDWNCNPSDLNNLLLQIKAWSEGRIDANLHPSVLDVGTEQIFELKPPFVYLTGHKDFHFLDAEVRNLRDYLMLGGAVWADSALVGRHSRFDLAFRREINKVLPDREFEPVLPDHDMYDAFFDKIKLPTGMNYYHEQPEMINIGGKLAVLYTLNGYGHLWESRLNAKGDIERGLINVGVLGKPHWTHVTGPHYGNGIVYRNVSDGTVRDAFKFGINVVVHLLVRYQRELQFVPKGLPPPEGLRERLEKKPSAETAVEGDPTSTNKPKERVHKTLGEKAAGSGGLVKPGGLSK